MSFPNTNPENMMPNFLDIAKYTIKANWEWWWESSNEIDGAARTVLTTSILILFTFWCLWRSMKPNQESNFLPPGPRGFPLVGYLPFLRPNLHHQFTELAQKYGPIFKLKLGNKLCIVLNSPSLAKEVVRDHDAIFANRDPPVAAAIASYGGVDIAWSSPGTYWRNMRKVFAREMLSHGNLEACYSLRKDEVRKAVRQVYDKIGTPIDIGQLAFLTELNVIMSMLWGNRLEGEKLVKVGAEFREVGAQISTMLGKPNISDFYPVLAKFDLMGIEKQLRVHMEGFDRVLDSIIAQHIARRGEDAAAEKQGKDFLQILLELKEQEAAGSSISMTQIKAILLDIVLGGTDTTARSIEWVISEIIQRPEDLKRVLKELNDVVGIDNAVEEYHLPKLQYLNAVMKETLRLHPALPFLIPRCPDKSCMVGGYLIPKGTMVFVNVWAIHRDPTLWENPSEFKPERFLEAECGGDYNGNSFGYLPFGAGRRICAGLPLAEKMVMFLLASLLHSFYWELPESQRLDLSESFGLVIRKSRPLLAVPTPRLCGQQLYV